MLTVGFDGHICDTLNNGFGGLTETDFAWATGEIMKVANRVCQGRVISVLEGGYNVLGGCASPLAQSVLAHVESLCSHRYEDCDPEAWSLESETEKKAYEEEAAAKGEKVVALAPVSVPVEEEGSEEEGSFDFDAMSEEEETAVKAPQQSSHASAPIETKPANPAPEATPEDDGSEDLENYDMPEIEEGELDKIVDPLANEGATRKREHKKVDYVALEAQLKKEEEEMRKKMKSE